MVDVRRAVQAAGLDYDSAELEFRPQYDQVVDQLKNLGYTAEGEDLVRPVGRDGSTVRIFFKESEDAAVVERVNSKDRVLSDTVYTVRTPVQMSTFLTAVA